jgi:hypothetical protein
MSTVFSSITKPAPWEHRRWRNGICRSRAQLGQAIAFFVVAAASAGFVTLWVSSSPDSLDFSKVRWEVLIPSGFALFGAGFLVAALIVLVRWLRFGRCFVKMHTVPGVIGGHFRGEVLLPESFPAETDVRMELICERTTTTHGKGSDDDITSVRHDWSHTVRVVTHAALFHDGHCVVPFDFQVPYGLADETDSKCEKRICKRLAWVLQVFAELKGPDLNMRFHVPVFRTAASDPSVEGKPEDEKPLDAYLHDLGKKRRLRMAFENGVNTYICDSKGLDPGVNMVPMILGVLFLAGGLLAGFNGVPFALGEFLKPAEGWGNLFRLIPLIMLLVICMITVVVGLFGLFFLSIGVSGLTARRTWVTNGMIRQQLSFLGIPWSRSCPCSSVIGVDIGSTSTSGGKSYADVVVTLNTSAFLEKFPLCLIFGQLMIATNVPTDREVRAIIKQLRKELRLREEQED